MLQSGRTTRIGAFLLVLAMFASACSADTGDSDTAEGDDVSRAAGTLADPNLRLVTTQLASGFGNLTRSQQQAVQGVADSAETCAATASVRAKPRASQIEIEVITVRDDCLVFSYEVADFRTFVADLREIRLGPDVVAASPLLLNYRLDKVQDVNDRDERAAASQDEALRAVAAEGLQSSTSPTGEGITIAVIDSGIDTSHPSLEGARVRRVPDSGSGDYVPDGHGTLAAAIIIAPLGSSGRGIAPAVELLDVPADLCHGPACGCDPCADLTPVQAIRWSADNGADVISMSFGYRPAPKPAWWQLLLDDGELGSVVETIEVALAYADEKGVSMVAAAGNCAAGRSARCEDADQFEIPAGHDAVIGVGASVLARDGAMVRAEYSTRQSYVELVAPGQLQLQSIAGVTTQKNGTSYSAPFVSAALALLLGEDGPLVDQENRNEVARRVLGESAIDLEPAGRDSDSGHGQLHLAGALVAAEEYVANTG